MIQVDGVLEVYSFAHTSISLYVIVMLSFPGTSNTELQDNDKDPLEYFLNDKIQELLIALTGKFYLSVSLKQGAFREGEVMRQCQDFREKFGFKFEFLYTFYTFLLLPQLKIGRRQPAWGDFFSQIAL